MPLFEFQALSPTGKKQKGSVHAETLFDAKNTLNNTDLIIFSIQEKKRHQTIVLSKKELLGFTRELYQLLQAGLPLFECLLAIEEKSQGRKMHSIILDLMDSVRQGHSLSSALAKHPKSFHKMYRKMVENGEKSGSIAVVLQELAAWIEKEETLKRKILSAISYPLLLFGFSLLILFALIFFMIPSLAPLFADRPLHPFTQVIFSISHFCISHQLGLFLSFCSVVFAAIASRYVPLFRLAAEKLSLSIPVLQDFFIKYGFIRFCRSSATLLKAGLPLVETLELAQYAVQQKTLEKELETVRKAVMEGGSLSKELSKSRYIPHFVTRMLSIAEKSGKAPEMFLHIAKIYEEEFDASLQQCTSVLQPVLLVFIGLVVGVVLLSVLLPLTDVHSFIQ